MAKRAAVYCRISKDDGAALGVARQRKDCEALAERSGWKLAGAFVDNDVSAFSGKRRPEYERLLDAVRRNEVDVIVAWHPDRLHRSPRELEDFIDVVETAGAQVATCTAGDVDLSTPDGRLMARIVGSVSRKESEDKSRRLRRKHQELAEAGKISGGGRRPFGFEADRMTICRAEAKLIVEAADRIIAGDSIRSVINDWKDRDVRTVTGAHWSSTTVKRLLKSGRISGQREHKGVIVGPAVWPAIITPEQTARLRAILTDPKRNKALGVVARSYLLAGFVYCDRCGVKMTTRPTGKGVRRYVCTRDRGGCDRCGISGEPLEDLIVEAVMQRLDTPALAAAIADRDDGADTVLGIAELEARLDDLSRDHYVDQLISRREYLAAREPLEQRLDALRSELATRDIGTAVDGLEGDALRTAWPSLSLDRRRAILATVIDRVDIAPTVRAANYFDPARVSLVYRP